ncbi:MAG: type II toxin-antitoxin system YoeB family toxin [Candidatus Micrarchaeota archaeon]|nr:type II toxin-antitoxin system YoeB family toxin [Candidatus Micrarchaeota archaeon]
MIDGRKKRVAFATKEIENSFIQLKSGKFEDKRLVLDIESAIDKLSTDPFCGIHIPRKMWPKEYVRKFEINNLWKLNLPNGWRLVYFVKGTKVEIVSILLEWFNHKNYEKRFGYGHG